MALTTRTIGLALANARTMSIVALLMICSLYDGHGRRVQVSSEQWQSIASAESQTSPQASHPHKRAKADSTLDPSKALANILFTLNPADAFSSQLPGLQQTSSHRRSRLGPRHVEMSSAEKSKFGPAARAAKKEKDELTNKILAGAMGAALAFSPDAAFAVGVDKTGPIGFVADIFEQILEVGHGLFEGTGMTNTYGYSIIILTLLLRSAFIPFTIGQYQNSVKMKKVKPVQDKIMKAFPGVELTAQRNEALGQLVDQGANPLAGCAPLLLQLPVLFGFYRMLTNLIAEDKLGEPFLWIPNLQGPVYGANPADANKWFRSILTGTPDLGWEQTLAFLSLPVIYALVQTATIKLLSPPPEDKPQPKTPQEIAMASAQDTVPMVLPAISSFFALNVPAALVIYWILSNIIGATTSLFARSQIDESYTLPKELLDLEERLDKRIADMADMAVVDNDPMKSAIPSMPGLEELKFNAAGELCGPLGTPLTDFVTPENGYGCDLCETRFPEGTILHSCRESSYDVCNSCFQKALEANKKVAPATAGAPATAVGETPATTTSSGVQIKIKKPSKPPAP